MTTPEELLDATGLPHEPSGHRWGHWVDVPDDCAPPHRAHVELPPHLLTQWQAQVASTPQAGPLPTDLELRETAVLHLLADLVEESVSAGVTPPAEVRLERLASGALGLV